ncbi:MAG: 2-hydroxyglutaryl-CoA dehydratase [Deltaproteobacteria bacterium]|nr:2-hydroxyglutaryl-CoA dehydratase [Deltaproteobacteria bacterium]MBW2117818.1 2-hydroxyglutaryl-CoA dehydratase [Deltaproteobacteria bacterium]MBW2344889.1 2-hydroxyglutaryl-CoA dehydratase [Deltaproteobacteria bacterium]
MTYFAGIDVGSLTTEVVILNKGEGMVTYAINATGANVAEAVEHTLGQALSRAELTKDRLSFIVATGYGRITIPFADKKITEISCHAMGAHHLFPDTETVIDIGGQDSKVIRIDGDGKVLDFTMNDKCAAGTGRFLEVMADTFQIPIDDFGALSLKAKREIPISSICTVFAESEVISLIARNEPAEDIIRGLHRSVVNRVWSMVQTVGVPGAVTMSGGVAKNPGVVGLLEEHLKKPIHIHTEPQIVGALGAAILAGKYFLKD